MARLLPVAICVMAALALVKAGALVEASGSSARADVPAAATPPVVPAPPPAPPPTPPMVVAAPPAPDVGPDERALLLDLRRRRGELDAREAALATREATAAAAAARLAVRMDELDTLRRRLEALEAARQDRDEASWHGLVRTYETMKPKDAAAIFDDLDMPVLLQVMDRMREAKAAPVLAAMLPDRARALTGELARLRVHAKPEPAVATATKGVP